MRPDRGRDDGELRRLLILRHAESQSMARSDAARSLTARGIADAESVGTWLAATGHRPDRVYVSSAARTRQTWAAVSQAAQWGTDIEAEFLDALYDGGPATALEVIRNAPDDVGTVLVVGHNPTVAALAFGIDDGEGDPNAARARDAGMAPATLVVIETTAPWAEVDEASGRVVASFRGQS